MSHAAVPGLRPRSPLGLDAVAGFHEERAFVPLSLTPPVRWSLQSPAIGLGGGNGAAAAANAAAGVAASAAAGGDPHSAIAAASSAVQAATQIADEAGVSAAIDAAAYRAHQYAAVGFTTAILALLAVVYRSHGPKGQLVLLTYVTALFSTQLAVKAAMAFFPFPMLVTSMHFASTWLAAYAFFELGLGVRGVLPMVAPVPVAPGSVAALALLRAQLSRLFAYLAQLRPIAAPAVALAGSVALNNAALVYIGASLNAVIGIATPLATAMLAAASGSRFAPLAWLGLLVAATGDVIACFHGFRATLALINGRSGGVTALSLGITLSLGAMMLRALKTVLQERLMGTGLKSIAPHGAQDASAGPPEGLEAAASPKVKGLLPNGDAPLEPMQLVLLQAPLLTGVAALLVVTVEGVGGLAALPGVSLNVAGLMALSCASATFMNFSGMCAIRMLGAPAAQLAGKLNVFVTAALSTVCFGEVLTLGEVGGAAVALAGLALYEKAQHHHSDNKRGGASPTVAPSATEQLLASADGAKPEPRAEAAVRAASPLLVRRGRSEGQLQAV